MNSPVRAGNTAHAPERSRISRMASDPKIRGLVAQAIVGTLIILAGYYLVTQAIYNMEKRGLTAGFDFLSSERNHQCCRSGRDKQPCREQHQQCGG